MKKILLLALSALLTLPVIARESDPVASSADGKVTFDMVSHVGYGYHFVKSADFTPSWSGDFFLNILKLGLYPVDDLSLELSLDFDLKNFTSKTVPFYLDADKKVQPGAFPTGASYKKCRGGINVYSLNAPLHVKYNLGHVRLGLGAEASFNMTGDAYYHYREDNKRTQVTASKAAVNRFSYGFFATLGVNDGCFFFKYYPKGSRLLPDGSVDLSFMTIGIAFGF